MRGQVAGRCVGTEAGAGAESLERLELVKRRLALGGLGVLSFGRCCGLGLVHLPQQDAARLRVMALVACSSPGLLVDLLDPLCSVFVRWACPPALPPVIVQSPRRRTEGAVGHGDV